MILGSYRQQAHRAISDAYSLEEFSRLLGEKLDTPLELLTPNRSTIQDAVSGVLILAEQAGWLPNLIKEAYEARPKDTGLAESYRNFGFSAPVEFQGHPPEAAVGGTASAAGNAATVAVAPQLEEVALLGPLREIEPRVCRVERFGAPVGTGFLVGPGVVLTAFHMVKALIDKVDGSRALRFRFDYRGSGSSAAAGVVVAAAADWLIDHSPAPAEGGCDYALIRLDPGETGSPAARGWIAIPESPAEISDGDQVIMVGYADELNSPLRVMVGSATRAGAQTLELGLPSKGSGGSGTPCFDRDFNVVAMLRGTVATPNGGIQGDAILVPLIRACLVNRGFGDFLPGSPPPPEELLPKEEAPSEPAYPMRLSPKDLEVVCSLIADTFDLGGLKQLTSFQLGFSLQRYVEIVSMNVTVLNLVLYAEQRGITRSLLEACISLRPERTDLTAEFGRLIEERFGGGSGQDRKSPGNNLIEGVAQATALLGEGALRGSASSLGSLVFHLDLLRAYLNLDDELQLIRMNHRWLWKAASEFPEGEASAAEAVQEAIVVMSSIRMNAVAVANTLPPQQRDGELRWLSRMEEALRLATSSFESREGQGIRLSRMEIEMILRQQHPRIIAQILAAVEGLDIQAIRGLLEKAVALTGISGPRVVLLKSAISAMGDLTARIAARANQLSRWRWMIDSVPLGHEDDLADFDVMIANIEEDFESIAEVLLVSEQSEGERRMVGAVQQHLALLASGGVKRGQPDLGVWVRKLENQLMSCASIAARELKMAVEELKGPVGAIMPSVVTV